MTTPELLELRKTRSTFAPPLAPEKEAASLQAISKLRELGYKVTVKNGGLHLQIQTKNAGAAEYWPTTERWWVPKLRQRGDGLDWLLKLIVP